MNVKFHKVTSYTRNFQNFTYVITILVKLDIHFIGLPWEILFGITKECGCCFSLVTLGVNMRYSSLCQRPWRQEILELHQQTVNEVQSGTGSACNTSCRGWAYTTYARRTKATAKHQGRQLLRSKWESKALHGKYPQRVKQADVDQDKTHRWLKAGGLKEVTEGFIIAAQDQSLPARWHQHNILKKPDVDPKCRLCGRFDETLTTWSLATLTG